MKAWSLFLPQVHTETYGAPEIIELEAIRNAAIEFCEKTKCWQETQQPYPLATGVKFYPFQVSAGQLVHEILAAHLAGNSWRPCDPVTTQWADENFPGWSDDGGPKGQPCAVTQMTMDGFHPVPQVTGGPFSMVLRVAYKPTRTATLGPDVLYNDYYETIAMGAKARLMAMVKQVWSNPQMAVAYGTLFDAAIVEATLRVAKGWGRGRIRVKPRFL